MFGSVVDSFTGEAVDSCLVTVWNVDSTHKVAETYNAKWGFKLGVPVSGNYIISYSHPRYMAASRHVRLNFSRHRRPRITLNPAKLRKRPRSKTRELDGGSLGEVEVDYNNQDIQTRQSTERFLATGDTWSRLRSFDKAKSTHFVTRHTLTGTPRVGLTLFRQLKAGRRVNISASVSARALRSKLDYQRNVTDTSLTKTFVFVEPQVRIGYERPNTWLWQVEYGMKQQAPAMTDLIPYSDTANPLIISLGGNSNIRSSLTHNVSLLYRKMDFRTRRMLLASVGASLQPRQTARAVSYDTSTGVQTVSLMNMRGRNAIAGTASYRTPFTKKQRFYANASATVNYASSTEFVNHKRTVNTLMPSAALSTSYEQSHTRIEVGVNAEFAHITSDESGFQPFHFFNLTYGVEGHTRLPLQIELTMDTKVYTRRGYNDASMNTDHLVVGASLSRSLLSDRLLLRLAAHDLLGHLDDVTRTVNAYGRTETWQDILGRYAMLSVQCKL